MLLTSTNRNTAILQNIVQTLEQIKISGRTNQPVLIATYNSSALPLDGFIFLDTAEFNDLDDFEFNDLDTSDSVTYTVSFYVDAARTSLIFTDTSSASPDKFQTISGRVFYSPADVGLNDNASVSTTKSQSTYYLTVTSTAGLNVLTTYDNSQNLLFRNAIVTSKPNPKFTIDANQAIIHPIGEVQEMLPVSGLHGHIIASFDLYIQQIVPDWTKLSEQNRIQYQQQAANMIRNALYADRWRGGATTFVSADLRGTAVKMYKPLISDAVLKGVIRVDCAYWIDGDSSS